MNERNSFYPAKANFSPDLYCNYLLNSSETFVEMIHTPNYLGMDFIGMYGQLFEYLTPLRDKIHVSTYSAMRAYAYERHHTDMSYLQTHPKRLKFKLNTRTRRQTSVPLTVNIVPVNPEMLNRPSITVNGQEANYRINGQTITLSVEPNSIVEISVP